MTLCDCGIVFRIMCGNGFEIGSWVVYPSHGVGKLSGVETVEVDNESVEFLVVYFEKCNLTLKIPAVKAVSAGLRKISTKDDINEVFEFLRHKSKRKKAMWSKRAQEYELKINSGNPVNIAQVVRELYKEGGEMELSFSERQMYQQAMERLAREVSVVENIDESEAVRRLEMVLQAA